MNHHQNHQQVKNNMNTFNYRVIRSSKKHENGKHYDNYAIHEVYYDDEDDSIISISAEPATIEGDSFEDLQKDMFHIKLALSQPILDMHTIKFKGI